MQSTFLFGTANDCAEQAQMSIAWCDVSTSYTVNMYITSRDCQK